MGRPAKKGAVTLKRRAAAIVRRLIGKHGMTYRDIGVELGLSHGAVWHWVNGAAVPSRLALSALAVIEAEKRAEAAR